MLNLMVVACKINALKLQAVSHNTSLYFIMRYYCSYSIIIIIIIGCSGFQCEWLLVVLHYILVCRSFLVDIEPFDHMYYHLYSSR